VYAVTESITTELISAGGALLVALTVLFGVIYQARKTRRQNTDQHAEGRDAVYEVLGHVLHLGKKVDGLDEKVDRVELKVDAATADLQAHRAEHRLTEGA
jgi:outer membrane murein-binding lipoprotein Lpp